MVSTIFGPVKLMEPVWLIVNNIIPSPLERQISLPATVNPYDLAVHRVRYSSVADSMACGDLISPLGLC